MFKALSDSNRLRILKVLEQKPLCVCEITSVLNISTSTVSKHLSILRDAGFIQDEKDGKWVEYKLNLNTKDLQVRQMLSLIPSWLNDDKSVNDMKLKLKNADRNVLCKV